MFFDLKMQAKGTQLTEERLCFPLLPQSSAHSQILSAHHFIPKALPHTVLLYTQNPT